MQSTQVRIVDTLDSTVSVCAPHLGDEVSLLWRRTELAVLGQLTIESALESAAGCHAFGASPPSSTSYSLNASAFRMQSRAERNLDGAKWMSKPGACLHHLKILVLRPGKFREEQLRRRLEKRWHSHTFRQRRTFLWSGRGICPCSYQSALLLHKTGELWHEMFAVCNEALHVELAS